MTATPETDLTARLAELRRLADAAMDDESTPARVAFERACTPSTVSALVALAERGAALADAVRWLDDNAGHELRIDRDGDDVRLCRWRTKYVTYQQWFGRSITEAVAAARSPATRTSEEGE